MTKRRTITQAYLKSRLVYDPETGIWRWLPKPELSAADRRWNGKHAGKIAGRSCKRYIQIRLDGKCYYAHRLAFIYMLGREPVGLSDHENRIRSDCRWDNLRDATKSQNSANSKRRSDNTSGHRGVRFVREMIIKEGWRAVVHHQGKSHHVGYFKTKEAAIAAWRRKAKELFGPFARVD